MKKNEEEEGEKEENPEWKEELSENERCARWKMQELNVFRLRH